MRLGYWLLILNSVFELGSAVMALTTWNEPVLAAYSFGFAVLSLLISQSPPSDSHRSVLLTFSTFHFLAMLAWVFSALSTTALIHALFAGAFFYLFITAGPHHFKKG